MAITPAALQAALNTSAPVTGGDPQVLRQLGPYKNDTSQYWLIRGGITYQGRTKFVKTTAANDAATQAAAVLVSLLASAV